MIEMRAWLPTLLMFLLLLVACGDMPTVSTSYPSDNLSQRLPELPTPAPSATSTMDPSSSSTSSKTPEASTEPIPKSPANDLSNNPGRSSERIPVPEDASEGNLVTLLPKDAIQSIDQPEFMDAEQATDEFEPDEMILGVVINGEARAYSIPHISLHEIVNDTVGGQPIVVTWCPLCYTGIVYARDFMDPATTFGVSGKLLNNALVMYDRRTGSLWSQVFGKAVIGPLRGTELSDIPSWHTTWQDWVGRYPETLALRKGYYGALDPYSSYYRSDIAGASDEREYDDRLYVKEFVIGVELNGEAVAYAYNILNEEPVINDFIGGEPVVVVFDINTGSGVVFKREINQKILSFQAGKGFTLVDIESNTAWDGLTGRAISGIFIGSELERVKSTRSFWFGWVGNYPDTRIYEKGR